MAYFRHFLDIKRPIKRRSTQHFRYSACAQGISLKNGTEDKDMAGRTLAMIFDKPSTRTRVSFAVGIKQLEGPLILSGTEMHLGVSETIADTARVLSRLLI